MGRFPGFNKYKGIIVSTALFVIFVVAVLLLNYMLVRSVESEVGRLQLSKDLNTALQQLHGLQELSINAPEGGITLAEQQQNHRATVAGLLAQLAQGQQTLQLTANHQLSIQTAPAATIPPLVNRVQELWQQFQVEQDQVGPKRASTTISGLESLASATDALVSELATQLSQKSDQLRMLQLAAMMMTLMVFFGIVAQVVVQLHRRDEDLEAARVETNNIMNTVTEGLFLLDPEYQIGLQQSSALQQMFGVEHELEGDFLAFLGKMVPDKTLEIAKDFLELLFGQRVKEKLIGDLNPLTEVQINIEQRDGSFETKFLCFDFRRVQEKNKLTNLLVSVTDVTRATILAQELEQAREQHEAQFDLLMNILHVDSDQLARFIEHTSQSLEDINETLKQKGHDHNDCVQKLEAIYRLVHRIKGDASSLNLHVFEVPAHEFENQIDLLRRSPQLSGKDLLSLAMQLKDLFGLIESVRKMVSKFASVKDAIPAIAAGQETDIDPYTALAQRVAERANKQIMVRCSGMNLDEVPELYRQTLHDAAVQLLRNAIVHGLETPQERAEGGKSTLGNVTLALSDLEQDGYELVVRDDGRGLNKDSILHAARERHLIPAQPDGNLSSQDILKLIFHPGFSTRLNADQDAGRGVGLDAVKDAITQLGGRIHVSCAPGRYCEFRVRLPAVAPAMLANADLALRSTA